ncbi:hypothetical protein D3C85_887730 [compost metagenome]
MTDQFIDIIHVQAGLLSVDRILIGDIGLITDPASRTAGKEAIRSTTATHPG